MPVMKNRIEDSFEDRPVTLIVGIAAWAYYYYHFTHDKTFTHLTPFMKPWIYWILFACMFALQLSVWIHFKNFNEKKRRRWLVLAFYFFCELGVLIFTAGLAFWPLFLILRSKIGA